MRCRALTAVALGGLILTAAGLAQSEPTAAEKDPWALVERQLDPTLQAETAPGPAEAEPASAEAPGEATVPAAPDGEVRPIVRRGGLHRGGGAEPATAAAQTQQPSLLRSAGSLAAVLALIGLCGWGYRAAMQRGGLGWAGRVRRPGLMEVVSRVTLGPKHSLCLVRLGPRMVLVGLGPERVSAIDVIADRGLAAELAGEAQSGRRSAADFAVELEQEAAAFESPVEKAAVLDETQLPEAGRLLGVHGHLLGTLQKLKAVAGSGRSAAR